MKPSQWKQPLMAAMVILVLCTISCSNMMDNEDKNSKGVAVVGVTLNKSATSIDVGSTEQLTATIDPLDATNKDLGWESSDEDIATVDSTGLVTAAAGGTATITVTTEDGDFSAECEVTANWVTGNKVTYTADNTTFAMVYVAGGYTFPTGESDIGTATVDNALWIGETEVTYELWKKVYDWAVHGSGTAIGEGQYEFANPGGRGGYYESIFQTYSIGHEDHPVTCINWRDAIVWCNALTEWYNANNSILYDCVYCTDSSYETPIRASTDSETITWESGTGPNDGKEDDPCVNSYAKGFRLLLNNEWDFAARYITDDGDKELETGEYYPGRHASGADSVFSATSGGSDIDGDGDVEYSTDVAVYNTNSGLSTSAVKSKSANALGLYDMNGNVFEWCFEWQLGEEGSNRIDRGSSWHFGIDYLQLGVIFGIDPYFENVNEGLRIGRSE